MARLNEAPAPTTESIDALKRRFVRQNREIARANSIQSLKIRSLESEIARLLAENLTLREQIIKLETGYSRRYAQEMYAHVNRVKTRLDEKVRELGQAISELGLLQYRSGSQTSARKSVNSLTASPSTERPWKNGLSAPLEPPRSQNLEGRLPTILEDKLYPRWTWSSGDILDLLAEGADPANTTDSPDLGPPPVAHFEAGDGPGVSSHRNGNDQNRSIPEPSTLTARIELRKKRRESANIFEFKKTSELDSTISQRVGLSPGKATQGSSYPLKTGAKRKFNKAEERTGSRQDLEDKDLKSTGSATDIDCKENGSSVNDSGGGGNKSSKFNGAARNREIGQSEGEVSVRSSRLRQVLQPRSTNMDPSTPLKQIKAKEEVDEIIPKSRYLSRNPGLNRKRDPKPPAGEGTMPQQEEENGDTRKVELDKTHPEEDTRNIKQKGAHPEPEEKELKQKESQPQPETPGGSHEFPRAFSESATSQAESRDTPIPSEAHGADIDGTMSSVRPSRRTRAGINYAEPNLRDKMRRPTKELVDAVAGEGKFQQKNLLKREDGLSEQEERVRSSNRPRSLVIKREEEQGSSSSTSWKDLPSASRSLGNLSESTKRTEGESLSLGANKGGSRSPTEEAGSHRRSSSGSQIAISALMARAGSRRSTIKDLGNQASSSPEHSSHASNTLDLSGSSTLEGNSPPDLASTRLPRRHSTIGNPSSSNASQQSSSDKSRPKLGHRRSQTTLDGKTSPLSPGQAPEEDVGNSKSVKGHTRSSSTGQTVGALERAAARRRSMML